MSRLRLRGLPEVFARLPKLDGFTARNFAVCGSDGPVRLAIDDDITRTSMASGPTASTLGMACVIALVRFILSREIRFDGLGDGPADFTQRIISHVLLLQGLSDFGNVGINIPSWSISVEFWTNILFAVLARAGLSGRWSTGLVALLSTALLATVAARPISTVTC